MAFDPGMPVLVVDDMKQLGFADVDEANDGNAALGMMRETDDGLVISDWNMEPMTGFELLREIRADNHLSRTPFIMVTAEKAGVNNYIVKPFNAATLKSKIDAVFSAAA
jgi:two-component system chemotaxis response regulator CheY